MVDASSDTAWEAFDPLATAEPEYSLCHGWAGIPIVALMKYIFKLEPTKVTKKRQENLAGIDWLQVIKS